MAKQPKLKIDADQVHVWIISAGDHQRHDPAILRLLSADEVARARRFKSENHAAQWAFFHACLREVLGAYSGQAPKQLQFQFGENGKPALRPPCAPPLFFNLSHSGELALLALTRWAPIGVDIEQLRELNDRDALVKRFFSAAEQQAFAQLPVTDRGAGFYHIWTRKEALIKANGIGLSAPLDAFDMPATDFSGWHLPSVRPPLPRQTSYPVQPVDPGRGYVGAVALEVPDTTRGDFPEVQVLGFQPEF